MKFFESQHILHICLATVGLRSYSSNEHGDIEPSNIYLLLYSILFALCNQLMAVYLAFHMRSISESVLVFESEVNQVTVLIEALGGAFFIALISYDALIHRNVRIRTFNQVIKIERMLKWSQNFTTLHTNIAWYISINTVLYFFAFQIIYYIVAGNAWVFFYGLQCWILVLSLKVVKNVIAFVETSAAYLNDSLRRAAEERQSAATFVKMLELFDEVMILNGMIGKTFGLTIFGAMCNMGLVTTVQLNTILITYNLEAYTMSALLYNTANLIWLMPMFHAQIGIGFAATAAYQEIGKISTLVNHFKNYGFESEDSTKIAHDFLLSDLRTEKCISVLGFYPLSKTTSFTILSTVVAYTLILVQFKQMEDDKL